MLGRSDKFQNTAHSFSSNGGNFQETLQGREDSQMLDPMTRYQRVEIEALAFYAMKREGGEENTPCNDLFKRLGLPSIESMTRGDYERARNELWSQLATAV